MKDAVWLACCPRNERRIVQREIESREVDVRLLWLDGVQALGEVLAALSEPVDGVVVLDDEGMRDELLALLAKVASSQVPCRAVVMVSELIQRGSPSYFTRAQRRLCLFRGKRCGADALMGHAWEGIATARLRRRLSIPRLGSRCLVHPRGLPVTQRKPFTNRCLGSRMDVRRPIRKMTWPTSMSRMRCLLRHAARRTCGAWEDLKLRAWIMRRLNRVARRFRRAWTHLMRRALANVERR